MSTRPANVVDRRSRGRVEADGNLGADVAGVGAQHDHPVGEQHRLLDVVGDDADGLGREIGRSPQLQQLGAQVLGGEHVERGERFVHQQHVRFEHQRAGEADSLAHAARELLGIGGLEAVEADEVDRRSARPCALGGGTPRASRPSSTFCCTVSHGSSAKLWNTIAVPGLAPSNRLPR